MYSKWRRPTFVDCTRAVCHSSSAAHRLGIHGKSSPSLKNSGCLEGLRWSRRWRTETRDGTTSGRTLQAKEIKENQRESKEQKSKNKKKESKSEKLRLQSSHTKPRFRRPVINYWTWPVRRHVFSDISLPMEGCLELGEEFRNESKQGRSSSWEGPNYRNLPLHNARR